MNSSCGCDVHQVRPVMPNSDPNFDTEPLYEKIKTLNEFPWEGRTPRGAIDEWLDNFRGRFASAPLERAHALYLLSKFLYFGEKEVRALLRAMFQDLVRNQLTVEARKCVANYNDFDEVHQAFVEELDRTRFVALGSPSESGTYLLYQFRQENRLLTNSFPYLGDLVTGPLSDSSTNWVNPEIKRLIFIDDFCGTGQQVTEMAGETVPQLQSAARNIGTDLEIWYLTLFATTDGLEKVEQASLFQQVGSLSVFDDSYRVFGHNSQYFIDSPDYIDKDKCEEIISHYGNYIFPQAPLGYGNCQLLLGFRHNVPDNTLPVIWLNQRTPRWRPIFERSHKLTVE